MRCKERERYREHRRLRIVDRARTLRRASSAQPVSQGVRPHCDVHARIFMISACLGSGQHEVEPRIAPRN
jgi:hypothetical protein